MYKRGFSLSLIDHSHLVVTCVQGGQGSLEEATTARVAEQPSPEVRSSLHELHEKTVEVRRPSRRASQQVSTIATRRLVVNWMREDEVVHGEHRLASRTIDAFPEYFPGSRNKNLVKVARWWKSQDALFSDDEDEHVQLVQSCPRSQAGRRRRSRTKTVTGRGHKQSEWVCWLYPRLLDAFEGLRKAGVNFSSRLLQELAREILVGPDSRYNRQSTDPKDGKLLIDKITYSWMQQFLDVHNVTLLCHRGRLTCSPDKERQTEMLVAHHLGVLHRGFLSGLFDENMMENIDETHFVLNCDNGRTLGFRGDDVDKYADVVRGGEFLTLVVRISGGWRSAIEDPMLIFTNVERDYPMRGLPDNVPGVTYRTSPKGWMDQTLFPQYFEEPRAFQSDVHGRTKVVWCDNCTGHSETPQLKATLASKRIMLRYLPPSTTHLCQPTNTYIISKIKDVWTRRWQEKKSDFIEANACQDNVQGDGGWSSKLQNPGKKIFLQLAKDCVEEVNRKVDVNGLTYARTSMIRCGLSLDVNGKWHVEQLFPHLQEIVRKYQPYFYGEPVPETLA